MFIQETYRNSVREWQSAISEHPVSVLAAGETEVLILPAMRPSRGYQGFRTAPIPSGWVQTGERWALWYNGRETASVTADGGPGVRLWMEGQKMWDVK